jgi:hypothetical protein
MDLDLLTIDNVKDILYNLNVEDVLNYCQHSKRTYSMCNEDFWKDYIEHHYDIKLLGDIIYRRPVSKMIILEYLKYLASVHEEFEKTYADTAIYLESIKIITFIIRKNGMPASLKRIVISPFESIGFYVAKRGVIRPWLYGDDILLYVDEENKLNVKGLKGLEIQPVQLEILNNMSRNISNLNNIKIKDITINGIPLIDQITTYEENYEY